MSLLQLTPSIAAFVVAAWLGKSLVLRCSQAGQSDATSDVDSARARKADGYPIHRLALLTGTALWSTALVIGTEVLGVARLLTPAGIMVWWGVVTALFAGLAVAVRRAPTANIGDTRASPMVASAFGIGPLDWLIVIVLAAVMGHALVSAWWAPPSTIDSLTYHLPRQVIWLQQHSVDHFETNNVRQVMMPPFAEFAQLHFMALVGDDRFSNMVSWAAAVLTAVAASVSALQLGADRRGQLLAAAFVALIPMVFVQASTPKNDVVMALWLVCGVVIFGALWNRDVRPVAATLAMGCVMGLGLLTKGTAVVFFAPLAVAFGALLVARLGRRVFLPALASALVVAALNAGHASRNLAAFGHPSGPLRPEDGGYPLFNETHAPPAMASSLLKNLALSLGTPSTRVNDTLSSLVLNAHDLIGVDPNDARLTYPKGKPFTGVVWAPYGSGAPGSPVHLALAFLAVPLALIGWRQRSLRSALVTLAICAAGYALFAAIFRWQLSHSRLLIPVTAAACPAIAVVARSLPWNAGVIGSIAAMLAVLTPTLRYNPRRVLGNETIFSMSSEEQTVRFWTPPQRAAFGLAMDAIAERAPQRVLFATHGNAPDYVIMRALAARMPEAPRFVYVREDFPESDALAGDLIVRSNVVEASSGESSDALLLNTYSFEFDRAPTVPVSR